MSELPSAARFRGRLAAARCFSLTSKVLLFALPLQAAPVPRAATPADQELLAASDLFVAAPREFRVELEVRPATAAAGMALEIWRRGEDLALVRLLAAKDRGKFLLRRDRELFLIAPGSARPVKLAPSYRLQGAALDELLGLRLVRDYQIDQVVDAGEVVQFDLIAKDLRAATPRLHWVVARAQRLPLRADLKASSGKVVRVVEFREWSDPRRGVPKRIVVKDVLRGGPPLEILFGVFETRPVPLELFALEGGSARAALPTPITAKTKAP